MGKVSGSFQLSHFILFSFLRHSRRMGVSASTVDEAYQQGKDYFKNWSRRMDPTKRSWQKRGELFHPLSE